MVVIPLDQDSLSSSIFAAYEHIFANVDQRRIWWSFCH